MIHRTKHVSQIKIFSPTSGNDSMKAPSPYIIQARQTYQFVGTMNFDLVVDFSLIFSIPTFKCTSNLQLISLY